MISISSFIREKRLKAFEPDFYFTEMIYSKVKGRMTEEEFEQLMHITPETPKHNKDFFAPLIFKEFFNFRRINRDATVSDFINTLDLDLLQKAADNVSRNSKKFKLMDLSFEMVDYFLSLDPKDKDETLNFYRFADPQSFGFYAQKELYVTSESDITMGDKVIKREEMDFNLLYGDPSMESGWLAVEAKNWLASAYFGRARYCTASFNGSSSFDRYTARGERLFYIEKRNPQNPKASFVCNLFVRVDNGSKEIPEFKNGQNRPPTEEDLRILDSAPSAIFQAFERETGIDLKSYVRALLKYPWIGINTQSPNFTQEVSRISEDDVREFLDDPAIQAFTSDMELILLSSPGKSLAEKDPRMSRKAKKFSLANAEMLGAMAEFRLPDIQKVVRAYDDLSVLKYSDYGGAFISFCVSVCLLGEGRLELFDMIAEGEPEAVRFFESTVLDYAGTGLHTRQVPPMAYTIPGFLYIDLMEKGYIKLDFPNSFIPESACVFPLMVLADNTNGRGPFPGTSFPINRYLQRVGSLQPRSYYSAAREICSFVWENRRRIEPSLLRFIPFMLLCIKADLPFISMDIFSTDKNAQKALKRYCDNCNGAAGNISRTDFDFYILDLAEIALSKIEKT